MYYTGTCKAKGIQVPSSDLEPSGQVRGLVNWLPTFCSLVHIDGKQNPYRQPYPGDASHLVSFSSAFYVLLVHWGCTSVLIVHVNGGRALWNASAASSRAFGHCVTPLVGHDLHKSSICITHKDKMHITHTQRQNTRCTKTKYMIHISTNTKCHCVTSLVGADLHNSAIAALL